MVTETIGVDKSPFLAYLDSLFSGFVSRLVVAFIILLFGFIIGKILGKIVHKVLHEIELNKLFHSATKVKVSLEEVISTFTSYFIYFIFIVIALEKLGIGVIAFNIVAAGVMVIIILSIFLGIKDFVPNLISGLLLRRKRFIKEGDKIKVHNAEGKIIYMNLVETRIKTSKGDIISIPNSSLTKSEVVKKKS